MGSLSIPNDRHSINNPKAVQVGRHKELYEAEVVFSNAYHGMSQSLRDVGALGRCLATDFLPVSDVANKGVAIIREYNKTNKGIFRFVT